MGDASSSDLSMQTMAEFPSFYDNGYNTTRSSSHKDISYTPGVEGLLNEQSMISNTTNAPFFTQLNVVTGSQQRGQGQDSTQSEFGYSNSLSLDMSTLGNALPEVGISPQYHNNQQTASLGGRNLPHMSPSTHSFHNAQLSPMSAQQYRFQPRQPLFVPGIAHSHRAGPLMQSPPYPLYGSYQQFVPQSPMPPRAQDMAGGPAQYVNPYGQPDLFPQTPIRQYPVMDPRSFMPMQSYNGEFVPSSNEAGLPQRYSVAESTPSYPRGPPRKPKQSGHALWVGNLPPGTNVIDLKDHFSREATEDIESLFLISKSNCAFVNYRTENACTAAMNRFHDSRFNGVRLVCRLRRGAVTTSTPCTATQIDGSPAPPTEAESPTEINGSSDSSPSKSQSEPVIASGSNSVVLPEVDGAEKNTVPNTTSRVPEKYFIVKSLTLQDLDASVRNGIWATQSHNEESLNRAFESADNVYLIFSANKSGEYYGYARMTSAISGEAVASVSVPHQIEAEEVETSTTDGPKSIPTPATEWAPKGRVVDDSARGTIFWEADALVDGSVSSSGEAQQQKTQVVEAKQGQDWGKPFKIEWISTNRLPFYRTRGLRNSWNANREVKIARDGTELEPSIGKRLVQMFHRPVVPVMPQGIAPMQPLFQPY